MCIRDRSTCQIILDGCRVPAFNLIGGKGHGFRVAVETLNTCLLYTSDAAAERSSVDLGGRRIIKKKKIQDDEVVSDKTADENYITILVTYIRDTDGKEVNGR